MFRTVLTGILLLSLLALSAGAQATRNFSRVKAGALTVTGNTAIGSGAVLGGSDSWVAGVDMKETFVPDGTSVFRAHQRLVSLWNPSANAPNNFWVGHYIESTTPAANVRTVNSLRGLDILTRHDGSGAAADVTGAAISGWTNSSATTTTVTAVGPDAVAFGAGNTTTLRGLNVTWGNAGLGTVVSGIGLQIQTAENSGGGAVTTAYGIKVEDQTVGGTDYAIYTGSGSVRFGDAVTGVTSFISPFFTTNAANPASAGLLRGANNTTLVAGRNATNTDDLTLSTNSSDQFVFGGSTLGALLAPVFQITVGTPSTTGAVRLASGSAIGWRNNAGSADLSISKNASDVFSLPALFLAAPPAIGGTTPAAGTFTTLTANTSLAINGGTALTTTNQTGTGSLVLATSPTLVTPILGAATGTSVVLTADVSARRFKAGGGTALVSGDFALSAGWGTTATVAVTLATSRDQAFLITVTSAGTGQLVNPTITLTFKDGTWTNTPVCIMNDTGGTGALADVTRSSSSATTYVWIWNALPVATSTYEFSGICMGT